MNKLRFVLEAALPDVTSLGGDGRNVDRDRLVNLLQSLAADLSRAYWIRTIVALVVLCVLLAVISRFGDQALLLGSAVAGMGITFMGAVVALKQVTDEMARVNLILAITPELSLEALTEIARKIISSI